MSAFTKLPSTTVSSTVGGGSAVSLTSGMPTNVTSVTLTEGTWLCWGNISFKFGATTNITYLLANVGTTTADVGLGGSVSTIQGYPGGVVPSNAVDWSLPVAPLLVTVAAGATTTLYLPAQANFTISTCAAYGRLVARPML